MGFTLDQEAIQYISYFENISGATIDDCVVMEDDKIVFIVKKGQAGLAIGRRGSNIKKAQRDLKKEIEIIENGETPEDLIKNSLAPADVTDVTISTSNEGKDVAFVKVPQKQRGIAIGKGGSKIDRCRRLVQRHFEIDEVILTKS